MAILGIGVDLVSMSHRAFIHDTFIKKILSTKEYACFERLSIHKQREYVASRFACKEAYLKARHKGIGDIPFKEIEILNNSNGSPYFSNDEHAMLSLSHEKTMVIAFVVIEGDGHA